MESTAEGSVGFWLVLCFCKKLVLPLGRVSAVQLCWRLRRRGGQCCDTACGGRRRWALPSCWGFLVSLALQEWILVTYSELCSTRWAGTGLWPTATGTQRGRQNAEYEQLCCVSERCQMPLQTARVLFGFFATPWTGSYVTCISKPVEWLKCYLLLLMYLDC